MTTDARERLRHVMDAQERRLLAGIPHERPSALLALVGAIDRLPIQASAGDATLDLVIGQADTRLGGNYALSLCLEAPGDAASGPSPGASVDLWAESFLEECGLLMVANRVLMHGETGFMRLVNDGAASGSAWIASGLAPASWRERVDFAWWESWLAARHETELTRLRSAIAMDPGNDALLRQLAGAHLARMEHQAGYPADAVVGELPLATYRDVLRLLIARALRASASDEPVVVPEEVLAAWIASELDVNPDQAIRAIELFTLDRENAAWHAAVPGIAPAPLVRLTTPDRLILSRHGLTAQPVLFLMRELRRRDPQAYHNAAWQREDVFRQDMYGLFRDKRFVASQARIRLRRDGGGLRTDVDAAVFDRKTGALAIFELKSQDPFARSNAEQRRQRDNLLHANQQIAGILDWLNRHGADELLNRIDHQTAKRFRVRKVLPFVLGRYLAHFPDGAAPDKRAAWATWPQVLRLTHGEPFKGNEANPLASLFARVRAETPLAMPATAGDIHTISLGDGELTIYPDYAAFRAVRPAPRAS